jgi:hypothetical protein
MTKGAGPTMAMIATSTLFAAMSQKLYLIIRKVEIAAGELATPPEAFIAGLPRSPPQPGLGRVATATKDGIMRLISGKDAQHGLRKAIFRLHQVAIAIDKMKHGRAGFGLMRAGELARR